MRYLVGFICTVAALVASPLSVSGQAGEQAAPKVALAIHTQHRLPLQLMLRASYFLYLDADTSSRLERWHPEAYEDPTKPASEPALKLELDSGDLEVTPTAPEQTQKKRSPGAKAGIAVGVIVGVGLVGLAIGGGVAMSNWEL